MSWCFKRISWIKINWIHCKFKFKTDQIKEENHKKAYIHKIF
ncbi:Uncharacterised protein [Campylobacter jejuni]|nr:Uncharacterised protein [Campylobacter jejuni]